MVRSRSAVQFCPSAPISRSCRTFSAMKFFTPARIAFLALTLGYIVLGTITIIREGNTEFLFYVGVLIVALSVVLYIHVRYSLPLWMAWLVSILGALHLAGGSLKVHGDLLYNFVIVSIPNAAGLTIWKFDQLVHPYGAAAIALITYALLVRTSWSATKKIVLLVVAFMVANGAGALNEVIEFGTKMSVPHTDVGGYYNTALDLCFNMLGAAIGSVIAFFTIRTNLDRTGVSR